MFSWEIFKVALSRELFKLLKSLQNVLNEPKKKIKIR